VDEIGNREMIEREKKEERVGKKRYLPPKCRYTLFLYSRNTIHLYKLYKNRKKSKQKHLLLF
jgi:hypothetical protein